MNEKTAEDTISYRCDGPTTREERRQIRARARAAAQERLVQEATKEAEARRAEIEAIKAQAPRQYRKAA